MRVISISWGKSNFRLGPGRLPTPPCTGVSLAVCLISLQYSIFCALGIKWSKTHLKASVEGWPVNTLTSDFLVNCTSRLTVRSTSSDLFVGVAVLDDSVETSVTFSLLWRRSCLEIARCQINGRVLSFGVVQSSFALSKMICTDKRSCGT